MKGTFGLKLALGELELSSGRDNESFSQLTKSFVIVVVVTFTALTLIEAWSTYIR